MRAKRIFEGYSPSINYGNKAMIRSSTNKFGKACSKLSNTVPYTYRVLQFNHSLEQEPTKMDSFNPIKVGDVVMGKQFVNHRDNNMYKGVVTKVKKTVDGILERVGINNKGATLWLDPMSVITVDDETNNINRELVLRDDSMDFDD